MDKDYDHKKIEQKWRKEWEKNHIYKTDDPASLKATQGKTKQKCFVLDMFPFPSGDGLHVGHPKGYIASDIYSRFKKMNGYNILHPMGWDAFGLPAEQYAIKNKIHPRLAVEKNVARFKEQLSLIGFNYDWEKEINTTDTRYYKWTQWIFLKLFEKGLAYESFEPVNWCPSCQTGLSNEDLDGNACERCGTIVEKKPMRQWVLKITDYADRLLADLNTLDWPEHVKEAQRNWIGRSEGALLKFKVKSQKSKVANGEFEVFTTRPDTLFGATYCVMAPEHKFLDEWKDQIENWDEVLKYREEMKKKTEIERTSEGREKTGVRLLGMTAKNPVNNEELPIFIADYVLAHYGTGAIMAVPAHDTRDYEFAKKFGLPIREVISRVLLYLSPSLEGENERGCVKKTLAENSPHPDLPSKEREEDGRMKTQSAYIGDGALINSGKFNGMTSEEAKKAITEFAGGKMKTTYRLRDWVFSRQRYWGEPIPVIHCEKCSFDKNNAKLELNIYDEKIWQQLCDGRKTIETRALNPEEKERYFGNVATGDCIVFTNKNSGNKKMFRVLSSEKFANLSELYSRKELLGKILPEVKIGSLQELEDVWKTFSSGEYVQKLNQNGIIAWEIEKVTEVVPVPEKDLPVKLPEVDSYEPTGTGESPLANIHDWVNVKCPKCRGDAKRETNTMPNWAGSSWYYLRYIDPRNQNALADKEKEKYWSPVDVYVGGDHATRHLIYARFWHKFLFDIGAVNYPEPFKRLEFLGVILAEDGRKMSKRWGNVVNPDDIVETYGADTLRVYEMFMGPFEQSSTWNAESIIGPRRFIERVWKMAEKVKSQKSKAETDEANGKLVTLYNQTIKKVGEDIEGFKFNTAVSKMMIFLNEMEKEEKIDREMFEGFLKILSPFAPHVAEELWHNLGNESFICNEEWPKFNESKIKNETMTIAVQVNGKLRATFEMRSDADENEVKKIATELPEIQKWLGPAFAGPGFGATKKIIYVKNKLVNIMV
jgi:leucyl-tRNA synthetase